MSRRAACAFLLVQLVLTDKATPSPIKEGEGLINGAVTASQARNLFLLPANILHQEAESPTSTTEDTTGGLQEGESPNSTTESATQSHETGVAAAAEAAAAVRTKTTSKTTTVLTTSDTTTTTTTLSPTAVTTLPEKVTPNANKSETISSNVTPSNSTSNDTNKTVNSTNATAPDACEEILIAAEGTVDEMQVLKCKKKKDLEEAAASAISKLPMIFSFGVVFANSVIFVASILSQKRMEETGDQLWLVAASGALYWYVMPAVMMLAGSVSKSCEDGAPSWNYAIYSVLAVAHASIILAWSRKELRGKEKGCVVVVVLSTSMFEHLCLGLDVLAAGAIGACESSLEHIWMKSWEASMGGLGGLLVLAQEHLGIRGYFILVFLHISWIPQVLRLDVVTGILVGGGSFAVSIFVATLCRLMNFPGAVILQTLFWFAWFIVVCCCFFCWEGGDPDPSAARLRKRWLMKGKDEVSSGEELEEEFCGLAPYRLRLKRQSDEPDSPLTIGCLKTHSTMTRLFLQDVVQLCMQTTSFTLVVRLVSSTGQVKQMLTLGVTSLAAWRKLVGICCRFSSDKDMPPRRYCVTLYVMMLCLLLMVYCAAKIGGTLSCLQIDDKATWNLSSGCVYDGGKV